MTTMCLQHSGSPRPDGRPGSGGAAALWEMSPPRPRPPHQSISPPLPHAVPPPKLPQRGYSSPPYLTTQGSEDRDGPPQRTVAKQSDVAWGCTRAARRAMANSPTRSKSRWGGPRFTTASKQQACHNFSSAKKELVFSFVVTWRYDGQRRHR